MSDQRMKVLTQGLVAGLIGYATVALVFAVANAIAGRSIFYTAALLGASLFYGVKDPAHVAVTAQYVFAYNGAHLVVFLIFGMVSAGLADLSERLTQLWYVGLVMFFFVAFHLVAAMQAVSIPVQEAIPPLAVWTSGAAAAVLMGVYLLWEHPKIRAGEAWDG
jgi:hypothetical protein